MSDEGREWGKEESKGGMDKVREIDLRRKKERRKEGEERKIKIADKGMKGRKKGRRG